MRSKQLSNKLLSARNQTTPLGAPEADTIVNLSLVFQKRYGADYAAACLKHFGVDLDVAIQVFPQISRPKKITTA